MSYDDYRQRMDASVRDIVLELECQPILFVGSGLSRRYFGAPGWHDALREALVEVEDGGPAYDYYLQAHNADAVQIGTVLAKRIHEWAWGSGRNSFPTEFFKSGSADQFIKYLIAEGLRVRLKKAGNLFSSSMANEIKLLASIRAHAIITTNFDQMLESIFDGYHPVVGQKILRYNTNSFGEIFKIHGCVSEIASMVLTEYDYTNFIEQKTYLSAKLLTYFTEHPVFVFGYSFNDPNVSAILAEVGRLIADRDGLIRNVFYVRWDANAESKTNLPEDLIISGEKNFRVKTIVTQDFSWIFKALSLDQELKSINTKLVRALSARVFKLVRTDIPKGKVEVDYSVLEGVAVSDDVLPKLLGINRS